MDVRLLLVRVIPGGAEHLGPGLEFRMDLKTYGRLISTHMRSVHQGSRGGLLGELFSEPI